MMTEKEYETLKEKRDKAEHFMDYWDGNVESLLEATRWIDDYENSGLTFADRQEHKEDSKMAQEISFAVFRLSKKAADRAEHWRSIYNALVDEVADVEDELRREEEALEYGNPEYNNPAYDEPDYGISRGEALWPEYAAMGVAI